MIGSVEAAIAELFDRYKVVRFYLDPPFQVYVKNDPRTRKVSSAIKAWFDDDTEYLTVPSVRRGVRKHCL